MASPQRRAPFSPLLLFFGILAFFCTHAIAQGVLGIDFGTEYIKAAIIKPGIPLDIVLTKDSKRKEAAALTFKPVSGASSSTKSGVFPERAYGGDALALAARFPSNTYIDLKPLLGLTAERDEDFIGAYKSRFPERQLISNATRGTVAFQSTAFEATEPAFVVEELIAMQLLNIKANAEAMAGKDAKIKDVVITVPVFYTTDERRAIQAAAQLAGLNVLELISDGMAVGLNYATSRTFPNVSDGLKPEYHLVYDMGAGSTTATVVRFQGRTVKDVGRFNKTVQEAQVVGVGWDKMLGGDFFNSLVIVDLLNEVAADPLLPKLGASAQAVVKHGRTMAKIWKEAERMRQVLSANTLAQATFEGFHHENAMFKYKLNRTHFETLAGAHVERAVAPVRKALENARLSKDDITSVILHGGMTRTPIIQKALEKFIGSAGKMRSNVNSDEAACFGAAFKAAILSPSYRVKDIRTTEIGVAGAGYMANIGGKDRTQTVFVPGSAIGITKQVPFKVYDDFTLQLFQTDLESTTKTPVVSASTTNLTAAVAALTAKGCTNEDMSFSIGLRLSPVDGLPEVNRAQISCEVLDTPKKASVMDGVKGMLGFGKKDDEDDELEETLVESESSTTSESAKPAVSAKNDKAAEPKKKTEIVYVKVVSEPIGKSVFDKWEMLRIKDRLIGFGKSEKSRKDREEAVNVLEGYTYRVRDMLENEDFISASTSDERSIIETLSKKASEWLYDDGSSAATSELKARLQELVDAVAPVLTRKDETSRRPTAIQDLELALNSTWGLMNTFGEMLKFEAEQAASLLTAPSEESASEPSAEATLEGLDALDDDIVSSSSTTSSAAPKPTLDITQADLDSALEKYNEIKEWLTTNVAEQAKLAITENPILSVADLEARATELKKITSNLFSKQIKMENPFGGKSSSSKSSKSKSKSAKKSSTKTSSTTATSEASEEVPLPSAEIVHEDL